MWLGRAPWFKWHPRYGQGGPTVKAGGVVVESGVRPLVPASCLGSEVVPMVVLVVPVVVRDLIIIETMHSYTLPM